jgi:DsbC/DsbD-like thiol-disulfide interchange protein
MKPVRLPVRGPRRPARLMRVAGRMAALAVLLAGCRPAPRQAAQPAAEPAEPSQSVLIFERDHFVPGAPLYLGVLITLAPGWYTYADPPGDSGMAPILTLDLPEGMEAGPLEYPPAKAFTDAAGTTYGFDGSVLLRAPLRVTALGMLPERVTVAGTLDYLICRDVCVPRRAVLRGELPLRADPAAVTEAWRQAAAAGGWDGVSDME